jgi:hypothetical protein
MEENLREIPETLTEVYEFTYTDCVFESAMATMSLHRTKKGAYKAMRAFLETEYAEWREDGIRHGKQRFKFGVYCAWAVRPIELKE